MPEDRALKKDIGRALQRENVRVTALFAGLAVLLTWPQAAHLGSAIDGHHDSLFNIWRIAWIAHALPRTPSGLFDANIFFPERGTLAYSDPVLLQGVLSTPFIALGVPAIVVYNLLVLGSFVLSGVLMYYLLRRLVAGGWPATIGAVVFAFAPYKFEHYFHLELLWAPWMPLALLATEALFSTGQARWGVLLGLALVAQLLSSLYYTLFLVTALGVLIALLLVVRRPPLRKVFAGLALCAAISAPVALVLAQPFLRARAVVGERPIHEIERYSATPSNYLGVPPTNRLYGAMLAPFADPERALSPGFVAALLAVVGIISSPWALRLPYGGVLIFAFMASLGTHTPLYGILRAIVPGFTQLRAPARFHIIFLVCLSIFVARGADAVLRRLNASQASTIGVWLMLAILCAEYATRPNLMQVGPTRPVVYRWLAEQPRGPVLELPLPAPSVLPGGEPWNQFHSTAHWFPLLNGYSGTYPPSYLDLLERFRTFPRRGWLAEIDRRRVPYLIVHVDRIRREDVDSVLQEIVSSGTRKLVGPFREDGMVTFVAVLSGAESDGTALR